MKRYILSLIFCILCAQFAIVNSVAETHEHSFHQKQLSVVVTTPIFSDIVENIANDSVLVTTLIPNGVDPHEFRLTVSASEMLSNADFIFYVGGIEESLSQTLNILRDQGKALSFLEEISTDSKIRISNTSNSIENFDPHVWLDPIVIKEVVSIVADKLMSLVSSQRDAILSARGLYLRKLDELHNATISQVELIPSNSRFVVTQHASFNYWAKRYGFMAESLEGISTVGSVGINQIDELASYIKSNQVKVIFLEETVEDSNIQALIDATRSKGWAVVTKGILYTESFGITPDVDSYLEIMSWNGGLISQSILTPPTDAGETTASFIIAPALFLAVAITYTFRKKIKKQKIH